MSRLTFIFALALLSLAPCARGESADGTYSVNFAGLAKGSGSGQLAGSTLSLTATLEDAAGNKGSFTASGLAVDDKNHFTGSGTAFGKTVKVSGRVDAPSTTEKLLKSRRIVGTYSTSDARYGRFAGFIPAQTSGGNSGGAGGGGSGDGHGGDDGGGGGGPGNPGTGHDPGPGHDPGGPVPRKRHARP